MPNRQFLLRLPDDLKEWLKEDAARNNRTMTGQVVAILRERMEKEIAKEQAKAKKRQAKKD